MKLSEREKAANRAAFRAMSLGQKAEYVLAYYKLPLVLALVAIVAVCSGAKWLFTHKNPLLYVACANVVPNDELYATLTTGFVEAEHQSTLKSEVVCYRDLYLSQDADQQSHQYAYASRLKLLAAIDAEELDVVLMNREAYDLLSASGYLLDLTKACEDPQKLPARASALLTTNTVVLSDNSVEVELGEADAYEADTLEAANALEVTSLPLLADFPADETFYLGVVANTPRLNESLAYLRYVLQATGTPA